MSAAAGASLVIVQMVISCQILSSNNPKRFQPCDRAVFGDPRDNIAVALSRPVGTSGHHAEYLLNLNAAPGLRPNAIIALNSRLCPVLNLSVASASDFRPSKNQILSYIVTARRRSTAILTYPF